MATRRLDIDKFREALLEDRERLCSESRKYSEQSQSDEVGDLADYDNHPADYATETFEREKDLALDKNVDDLIDSIDRALGKIDAGTYGICDRCGREISRERLKALPYATFCIDCQDIVEGR